MQGLFWGDHALLSVYGFVAPEPSSPQTSGMSIACIILAVADSAKLWNSGFFENVTLESLGLIVNLHHHIGDVCSVNPDTQYVTVIDLSGRHVVRVRFCTCSQSSFLEPSRQLLRVRWYPASVLRPKTVFTFDLLDTYHKISLQGKLNLYDFYNMIMQKTDNCGRSNIKVCWFVGSTYHTAHVG